MVKHLSAVPFDIGARSAIGRWKIFGAWAGDVTSASKAGKLPNTLLLPGQSGQRSVECRPGSCRLAGIRLGVGVKIPLLDGLYCRSNDIQDEFGVRTWARSDNFAFVSARRLPVERIREPKPMPRSRSRLSFSALGISFGLFDALDVGVIMGVVDEEDEVGPSKLPVIRRSVSFTWTSLLITCLLMLEIEVPFSMCWSKSDGESNVRLQLTLATHCRTFNFSSSSG